MMDCTADGLVAKHIHLPLLTSAFGMKTNNLRDIIIHRDRITYLITRIWIIRRKSDLYHQRISVQRRGRCKGIHNTATLGEADGTTLIPQAITHRQRSEERRVGKEC